MVGLDERIGGGIPSRALVLVAGPAGSLKSSFAYRMLHHAAVEEGAHGLYISMEQGADSLDRQVRSLGLDPAEAESLRVVDLRELRKAMKTAPTKQNWFRVLGTQLDRYRQEMGIDLLALDSLNALYALTDLREPRRQIFDFFEDLRALGATCLLLSETLRDGGSFGPFQVEEFLADGIVHLDLREVEVGLTRSVRRYIAVAKLRGVKHDLDYHPLLVDRDQFEIVGD